MIEKKKNRILMIEDSKVIAKMTINLLSKTYEVIWKENAEDALVLLDTDHDFYMMLVDYILPEMNGDEFINKLAYTELASLPKILWTSIESTKLATVIMTKQGVYGYATKPVDSTLFCTIECARAIYDDKISRLREERERRDSMVELMVREQVSKILESRHSAITLGEMTPVIAHEVKNLLQGPLTTLQLLQSVKGIQNILSSDLYASISEALHDCATIREQLASISDFGRKDPGSPKRHDLVRVIKHCISMSTAKKSISFEAKQEPIYADIVMSQIDTVFINLLNNAAHAIANKKVDGHIRITIEKIEEQEEQEEQVKISIQDNGYGMTQVTKNHLFDNMYTTKPQGQGSGIGMYVVKKIISQHNGSIKVDSIWGEGSTLTIYLPIKFLPKKENKNG